MPQHKSCLKRMKTAEKANRRNRSGKSAMRTAMKKALSSKSRNEALPLLRDAVARLDKLTAKGIIHRNKAANAKSALDLHYNRLP